MNRPEVRIVTHQSEEIKKPANISKSEEEALLSKYGYSSVPSSFSTYKKEEAPTNPLTFEEMVLREDQKKKEEDLRRRHQQSGPKPITFDGDYSSETKYGDSDGFSFKINVVTNIK